MRGRFYDGRTSAAHEVEVEATAEGIAFQAGEARLAWAFADIETEALGDQVRLGRPAEPARLVLPAQDWRAAKSMMPPSLRRRGKRRELRLVAGLTLGAATLAAIIFVGVPLASGPLARRTPPEYERQMGDSFEAQLRLAFPPCHGQPGQDALQALAEKLEDGAATPFRFRIRAVEAPMANAFALPGGAILVTDDLIEMAKTPEELAAVIAHEAAHVELRHVMQAVWRSLGLGLILDAVVGGGTGAGQQAVLLVGSFTDLRYSRDAELEADARGQELLQAARLSSEGMAPFFERIATRGEGPNAAAVKELISTHPDTARRSRLSRARGRPGGAPFPGEAWSAVKEACEGGPERRLLPRIG